MINDWQEVLYWVTIASITIANIFAVRQQNLKRLMAFSSISQAGYIMLGVIGGTAQGMTALVYYVLVYAAANLGVFAVITIVALRSQKFTLEDYAGLYKTNPKIALLMTLSLFSLAGIPPFAGFFSKFFYLHGCFRCRFPLAGTHRIGKYSDFVVLLSIDCKSNVHHSFRQPDSYFPQRSLHKMGD